MLCSSTVSDVEVANRHTPMLNPVAKDYIDGLESCLIYHTVADTRSLEYPSQAVNGRSNSSNGATSSLPSQTSPEIDEPSTSGSNAEQTYGEYSSRGADGGQSSSDPASERNSGRYIAAKDRKIGTPLQRTPSGMPRLIPPGEVNIKPGDRVVGSVVWSGPSGWKVELQAHKELIGYVFIQLQPR